MKIDKKIVRVQVFAGESPPMEDTAPIPAPGPTVVQMHESIRRPEALSGITYKIKSPSVEHALYVTINDIVLNAGTSHEVRRPYEIFINTKDATSHQWVVALTRVMSAVFRKGGDASFLIEELQAIYDPKGGYFFRENFFPSVIAHLGAVLKLHLESIGMVEREALPEAILEKKAAATPAMMEHATVCEKCHSKSVLIMDGCATCVECGHSKCG